MTKTFLIITSIANHDNPVLIQLAKESLQNGLSLVIIGDTKSPKDFILKGAEYHSIESQLRMNFELSGLLPYEHYSRKNLGYLIAIQNGARKIIETDDDNYPYPDFWSERSKNVKSHLLLNKGWVNIYGYFTKAKIWPRGLPLKNIQDKLPELDGQVEVECPIQQGLADQNPDVDAIYRLIFPLPVTFNRSENIALGKNTICPFNSQNTTWFEEAFTLLYLPSFCSVRMTDIWRSFVAQRIAWSCGWAILFHSHTVWQKRNEHDLLIDFRDEIPGYLNNNRIFDCLKNLSLKEGAENIETNMVLCYEKLVESGFIEKKEIVLLNAWLKDVNSIINK